MKVALVGDYPPPFGGVSVHVAALERELRRRGIEVRVLDVGRGDHAGAGVARARGALRGALALGRVAAGRWLLHVHTNGANAKSWGLALAAARARLPGAPPGVLTLHSGRCPAWLAAGTTRRALARAACAGHGRVLAVNAEIAAAVAACGVPPGRIAVLPAFMPGELAMGEPPPALTAFRRSHAPLYCAAVAPGATYGDDVLLEAFAAVRGRAPRAGLALFGPGSERGRGAGAAAVLALGELWHGTALAVIAACDVFVRATRADGDALSVREALALGRSVVASDVGHRPPGCLLFRAGDARDLAGCMVAAAQLPRPARGGVMPAERDPFEALLEVYRAAAADAEQANGAPPLPSDSGWMRQGPSSGA